jgi:hypothetical protein
LLKVALSTIKLILYFSGVVFVNPDYDLL